MEISLLKQLLNNVSSFLQLSSSDDKSSELIRKYSNKSEEILKLLKPVLAAIVDTAVVSDEVLYKIFDELDQYVNDLTELFENWQPLSSKIYFVLQVETLLSKVRTSSLDIFEVLKSSDQHLPDELNSASLEHCVQKIKHMEHVQTSSVIKDAIRDQVEDIGPRPEVLVKLAESLSLISNQEILIEGVALQKVKDNLELAEKTEEAEFIDQLITLVTHMHERLGMMKQSQSCSPVPIPADFCCPLSLELMTDPVIVASGQTYERAYIRSWLDLGLTVCPKTRQTLAHTNLIPNYTVKALIANWCESNNVKLPDRLKSLSSNHSSFLVQPSPETPKDSNVHSNSRCNQTTLPESSQLTGSPGRNMISSSRHNREGTSPLHPISTSRGSFSGTTASGQGLDVGKMSPTSSDDRCENSGNTNLDSVDHPSKSQSTKERQELFQSLQRAASDSSSVSNLGEPSEDPKASNHLRAYSSDPSGEVTSDPPAASTAANTPREPDLHSRSETRPRNQTIWRRPGDRFLPRIVSSAAAEARPDLSGVEAEVRKLVEDLKSLSVENQRDATAQLRLLAKHNMDNRIVIANCGAINLLVDLLRSTDLKTQENAVTALLNLSINDNNKAAIANANAIEPLIHVLETGSPEARENSAATLFSLSVIEENKIKIGRSGAIEPLVNLLGSGTPRGKKDASTALFNLSIFHENKARIVQAGAVKHLVELMDPAAGMVDKAVAVLANLATIPEGRTAIGQEGGIPVLVEVVELGSARGKENAAAALLQLCTNSNRYCSMVLQEGAVPPLVALSQSGTPRAREKAQALLSYFRNQRHGNAGR